MRYNTGNPVGPDGSNSPFDLNDNAGVLDQFTNGDAAAYPDRLGRYRKSLAGMRVDFQQDQENRTAQFNALLSQSGFIDLGPYDDGPLAITAPNQMFSKDGAYWTPKPSLSLPYTTQNDWNADRSNFINRGDAAVRTELYGALAKLDASSDKFLVDLHYGICKGVGYNGTGGERVTTTTSAVASGQSIPVADATGFVVGQLIVYLAGNGEYYTAVIAAITGNTIAIQTPIEVYLDSGAEVGIFYVQESHATVMGYKAIADAALRQATKRFETIYTWTAQDSHILVGGATESQFSDASYSNPGSSNQPALLFTAPVVGAGVSTAEISLPAGDYIARVFATPNLNGSATMIVSVSEAGIGAISYSALPAGQRPIMHEAFFRKSKKGRINVSLLSQQAGQSMAVSRIEIVRLTGFAKNLDRGVHVLLGDSWFAQPGIAQRLVDRLPNATIINKGVGGNTAENLWLRFDTDVRPYNPDFVWVMCGTNDVATGVSPELFYTGMGITSQYIGTTGATGIFFNCSVGAPNHPDYGDLLTPSRNYVINEDYIAQGQNAVLTTETYKAPINISVAAGSAKRILVPGFTKKPAILRRLYAVGQGGETTGNVRVGFGTSVTAVNEDIQTYALAELIRSDLAVPKVSQAQRFLIFEIQNTGSAEISVGGFIELEWSPVR
ncbi:GDSL-type esterase/lipase family protein [Pseudomonas sp. HTZ1]|uniref:GDSL-type esterase/lipase family protein n=1 Tax=Pseudomonas sp. HTZ1 TaxID=3075219 RepID=UPI00287DB77B|nr:GDSL-type esterase/lipase family protein [Pseudomonas sp. HTZ1]MDS9592843.1 GDSL-type esterase/lipase family protein [Pseudomonas sp. HTZ1]